MVEAGAGGVADEAEDGLTPEGRVAHCSLVAANKVAGRCSSPELGAIENASVG